MKKCDCCDCVIVDVDVIKMKRLLLLVGLLFWSCEDDRTEEPLNSDVG